VFHQQKAKATKRTAVFFLKANYGRAMRFVSRVFDWFIVRVKRDPLIL
jgi:hypothetical protein